MCEAAFCQTILCQLGANLCQEGKGCQREGKEKMEKKGDPSHASSVCTCDVNPDSDFTGGPGPKQKRRGEIG